MEFFLINAVAQPVKPHCDGSRFSLFCLPCGDTCGGGVVGNECSRRLSVSQVSQCVAQLNRVLGIEKEGGIFRFHRRGENAGENFAENQDGRVHRECGDGFGRAKEMDTTSARAGASFGKVRAIGMNGEDNFGGLNDRFGVRECRRVLKEAVDVAIEAFGGFALGGGKFVELSQHRRVDGASIV